jgi:hypothetical protein
MGYDKGPQQFGKGNIWAGLKSIFQIGAGFYVFAGAPVSGTSGTFAGSAGPGASLYDSTTGNHYTNLGTTASPVWINENGPAGAGISGLGLIGNAKMSYSFAVDGGAQATITPVNSPLLPIGAIILGGVIDIPVTIPVGVGASIGLGLGSGAQVASILAPAAISGVPWSTIGLKAIIPVFTAATAVKVAAATRLTLTISAANLTAGLFDVNVVYVQGNLV